jgi:ParB/RepB/Spo0J family partition protein
MPAVLLVGFRNTVPKSVRWIIGGTQDGGVMRVVFESSVSEVRIDAISPDPEQPRKVFSQDGLDQLCSSLKSSGLLQPIVIRPAVEGDVSGVEYILIAGERRWRAAGLIGWENIPAIIKENISKADAAKLQLLENIVREDLNSVEEARAFKKMLDEGYSLQTLSETVGLAGNQISWRVEMLGAQEYILELVAKGHMKPSIAHKLAKLSVNGQERAMRAISRESLTPNEVIALCERIKADESQVEMFYEPKLTEDNKRVAKGFGDVFGNVCSLLNKLNEMEESNPGAIAEALSAESNVAEAKLEEMVKGLYRVKKALQTKRMHDVAAAV